MKKQITWLDGILKLFKYLITVIFFSIPISFSHASDRWVLDKSLSTIEFELPVLFVSNRWDIPLEFHKRFSLF